MRLRWLLASPVLLALGCVGESTSLLVPTSPFGNAPVVKTPPPVEVPAATTEVGRRVNLVGQKIVAANPQFGLRPVFCTIGSPDVTVFHRGAGELFISEGLVKKCETDGALAAVLCHEMGKMVSEREAKEPSRRAEPRPPIQMPVGNDRGGSLGAPDMTAMAELAAYDRERKLAAAPPPPPPDPHAVSRALMMKAGYNATDEESARAILKEAEKNVAWEKQMAPQARQQSWTGPSR